MLSLMSDKGYVEGTFEKFNVLCGKANVKHEMLLKFLPKEEVGNHEMWFKLKTFKINVFITDVNEWIFNGKDPKTEGDHDGVDVEPQDSISNVGSNAFSKCSGRTSNVSKGSSRS